MAYISSAVKQQLRLSHTSYSSEAVHAAYKLLQEFENSSGSATTQERNVSSELYILCTEAAIEKKEWALAEACLKKYTGKRAPTKALEARALYCEALVALSGISHSLRGRAKLTAHIRCATKIVAGIKVILEEWPKEQETLIAGIDHLWSAIQSICGRIVSTSILEILVLVVTLHEKLSLGGIHTQLLWIVRYAICLRSAGRVQDAINQILGAAELVAKSGSERLQLQFYRIQVVFTAGTPSGRPKQENVRPVFQALHAVHSFFCGVTDDVGAKQEIVLAYERLVGDPEKKELKQKGRKAAEAEAAFRDPSIVADVLSEVVLALAMCGADDVCTAALPRLLNSDDMRTRLFTEYSRAVLKARECGSLAASKALDAGYLTKNMADKLFACISHVEDTIDAARGSVDVNENMYAIEVGCVVLWNLCLPLLQPQTRGKLRLTLSRIVALLKLCGSRLSRFFVRVAYESALAEFEEENMNTTIEQVEKALEVEQLVDSTDYNSAYPMDFALLWLKQRAMVRKAHESNSFSCEIDHAIHLIEQARLASMNRVNLLVAAANKLPPIAPTEPASEVGPKRLSMSMEKHKTMKNRRQDVSREPAEERVPFTLEDFIVPNVYYLLLKEAAAVTDPAVDFAVTKAAEGLERVHVPENGFAKDLLVMKAEAHLIMSDLITRRRSSAASLDDVSHAESMSHLSKAAQLGSTLSSLGHGGGWLVVNACVSLINQYSETFKKGLFLPAAAALRDLSLMLGQVNVDPTAEHKIFNSIGFGYVMSLMQTYINAKGEVDGELHCESLSETMRKTYLYPVCEPHSSVLKQAAEACHQMMSKWALPSRRKNFSLLLPCINRLLDRTPEVSAHPQEQLLFLLGRLSGPMESSERRQLVNTECLEMLKADPSVELCARLAFHSVRIPQNERVTLEICRIADRLYHEGKLGWGTKSLISANAGRDKSLANTTVSAQPPFPSVMYLGNLKGSAALNSNTGMQPKPTDMDWYCYADVLLHEATLFLSLGTGADWRHRFEFEKRVLVAITNSAVAASRSTPEARVTQISRAYRAFCNVAPSISRASRWALQAGLQILLSTPIMTILHHFIRCSANDRCDVDVDDLCASICQLGGYLFANLLEDEKYKEGIKQMHELLRVLPQRYHRSLYAYEAQLLSKLGLETTGVREKARLVNTEVEAAVCVAIAKNARNTSEGMQAWNQALKILEARPVERADLILAMSEWLTAHNAITKNELISLLLTGLGGLERVDNMRLSSWMNRTDQRNTDVSPALRHALTGTMVGRSFSVAQCLTHSEVVPADKQKDLPTLLETLTAVRILYFLFVVAPVTPCSRRPFVYKRCCASTLLYYILSCWKVVAVLLQVHNAADPQVPKVAPLILPEAFYEWNDFRANPQHADIIRNMCKDGSSLNTPRLWEMLLDVCDYLLEDGMELYVFLILSWIQFCIYWRYGESDPRGVAATRAVRLKGFMSAMQCGWGTRWEAYNMDPPSAEYWLGINEVLLSTEAPEVSAPLPSCGPLEFSNFVGSTHRFVLREAESLFTLGRVQESLLWSAKVKQCASRAGDMSAVERCRLLETRTNILRGHCEPFEGMRGNVEGYSGKEAEVGDHGNSVDEEFSYTLTVAAWTELQLANIDSFLTSRGVDEAVLFVRQLLERLLKRFSETDENSIERDTVEMCHKIILQKCASRFIVHLNRPFDALIYDKAPEGNVAGLLEEICSQLKRYNDWKSLLASLRVRQSLRPCVDGAFLDGKESVDTVLPGCLYAEYSDILFVAELLLAEMNSVIPISTLGGDATTRSIVVAAYDEVLVMCARNCLERKLLKSHILKCFNSLSITDLGIPAGGPADLEGYVVSYMRGPALYEHKRRLNNSTCGGICTQEGFCCSEDEVTSSLDHFGIPHEHMNNTSTPYIDAILYRAMDCSCCISFVQIEANIISAVSEFNRRLSSFNRATYNSEISQDNITGGGVCVSDDAFLTMQWSKVAVPTPHLQLPRRGSLSERRAAKLAIAQVEDSDPPPANLWIDPHSNLEAILLSGVAQARHMFEYKKMSICYIHMAHNLMLSNAFNAAGTAIELAQAAAMYNFITELAVRLAGTSPEAVLVRLLNKMKVDTPHLVGTKVFETVRNDLLEVSAMWRRLDLAGVWPEEPNKADPLPSDTCALSAVREGSTSYFLVSVRRQDGEVCSRRVELDVKMLRECTTQFEELKRLKVEELANGLLDGGQSSDVKWGQAYQLFFERVKKVASPLLMDFGDLLCPQRAASCSIYLCLDPILQPLPLEQLPELSSFVTVHRELSVTNLRHKALVRGGKQPAGGTAYVIDPFGENETALQYLFGGGRIKTSNAEIITFVRDPQGSTSRPSPSYVHRVLSNKSFANVVVNTCGSFSNIVNPTVLSELYLDHVQTLLIAMAANDASYCREQRGHAGKSYLDFFYERCDVMSILLLARGVHHVVGNIFPLSNDECNAFSKRCLALIGGGGAKAFVEAIKAPSKDATDLSTVPYVSYGVPHHSTKQK